MRYKIRIYMGDQIKDLLLDSNNSLITVGSSDADTLKIRYPEILSSHISFEYIDNKWTCFDKQRNTKQTIKDGDVFVVSMEHRVAAMVCAEETIAQKVKLKVGSRVSIGRSFDCMFHLPDRSVGNNHALIITDEMGSIIKDLNSLNGTFLNNKKISECSLTDGDIISIGKHNILFKNGVIELCGTQDKKKKAEVQYPVFNLSPRLRHKAPSEIIEIQAPPNIGNMPMVNWLSFLPMLATRSPYSAIFPLTSVFSTFLQKKKYKKAQEVRQEKYETYLAEVKAQIDKNRNDQFLSLEESNHETSRCYDIATRRERTLWERTPEDDDFMKIRIGKGDIETSFRIKFPDSVLKMYNDELEEQGEELGKGNQIIEGAPILCDLANDLSVGIIGERKKVISVARNMIVQVTTTHSYKDVKLVTLFSKKEQNEWEFVKWLPHSFNDSREFRYIANDVFNASVLEKTLDEELKGRKTEKQNNIDREPNSPFYLFVVADPELIEASEIENYLDANDVGFGIGVIYVYNELKNLPKSCNVIVDLEAEQPVVFHKSDAGQKQQFSPDAFTNEKADKFARSLAPVRLAEKKNTADMPTCVTFLEGYGVKRVEELPVWENWNNTNPAKSITVPLGIRANGEPFMFNVMYGPDFLRYHGTHGLVAGATRSGKSEMVQSWVLSLATKYSPQEVSFIIVDYKGTGMLLPFQNLPHLAGKISNLDGNVKRNIIAINQEIKRRQLLFDKLGIKPEIKEYFAKGYHKTVEPMPVIIVIVDEFAEVKKNLPEFTPVLESLFAVGSAMGIWVILSTQKPSGVVTDKMYANSSFRWCCRVASSADSKEMLHHADAAKISNAGRAYVQVGEDDIYEQVQSFWSGAPYMPEREEKSFQDVPISVVDITGKRTQYETYVKEEKKNTIKEIDAVVTYINRIAQEHNISPAPKVWQERLSKRIYIDDVLLNDKTSDFIVPVGMIDNPYEQAQYPLKIDFSNDGHCMVYGAPGTGKTTFLQTLIMSVAKLYSPEEVNIYGMDFGSWSLNLFSDLPQVGGIANDNEEEKIEKLVNMLKKELDIRKKSFGMNGVINIKSYEQITGEKLPYILLVIDNFNALFSLYPNLDDFFVRVSREGAAYGIYLIASVSGSTGVSYKILNNMKNNISLQMKDKADYTGIVGKTDGLEPENILGRGLVKGMPFALEFQTALPAYGEDDNAVLQNIKKVVKDIATEASLSAAKPIPIMPDVISYGAVAGKGIVLGLSTDTIEPVEIDTSLSSHIILVSSNSDTEAKNLLTVVLKQFNDKMKAKIILYDNGKESLTNLSGISEKYINTAAELDGYIGELAAEMNKRKSLNNLDEVETIVIGIDGYKEMYDAISDDTAARLSAIVRMGKGLKVFLVVAEKPDKITSLHAVEPILKMMVSDGIGILLGGTFKSHSVFNVNMSYTESNTQLNEFEAYIVDKGTAVKFKAMCEF